NKGRPWWHKRGLTTDICYWLIVPLISRFGRIGITILITVYLLGINTTDGLVKFFEHGHGVLSRLPFWVQFAIYLFGTEFSLYWIHRAFHGRAFGAITRSITPPRTWNGYRPRAFIPSIFC